MKFTFSWLKQYLQTDASLAEICDKLTAIGLEVEAVHDRSATLKPFIIAEVLTAEKHPAADRLKVALVDTGTEKLQVVCGAPNCRAGLKTVLARPGDVMPNTNEALKKGSIRGVESQGMLCAADELLLGDDHEGIIELAPDAKVGANFAVFAGFDDPVIEINLTPNRSDCAGVKGVARDLSATGIGTFKDAAIPAVITSKKADKKIILRFSADDKACPLFAGRLISNIKNGPSPLWLQQKLKSIGLRPISALVDITNYLTFDCARPLHVFDADKIKGDLWVGPAKGGETLDLLNGNSATLDAGMSIIGDDSGPLSLAGIMGGKTSATSDQTKNVFIESALFDAGLTARTGRKLQISSDARYRFERGVDPAFTLPGLELASQLVLDLCGTKETIVSEITVAGEVPSYKRMVDLAIGKCQQLAAVEIPSQEQERILKSLGFEVTANGARLIVSVPSWRPDIEEAADLVEEIVRIKGFDLIPALSLEVAERPKAAIDTFDMRSNLVRRALAEQGLMEAVTWSFMSSKIADLFGEINPALRLLNPISADLDVMRPSILGNLILAAKRNADRGFADIGIFEVGPVYKDATEKGQSLVATAIRKGATPRNWLSSQRPYDLFDLKADALAALQAAGVPTASIQVTADAPAWYHPGRSGSLKLGPALLAHFGDLHPSLLKGCDVEGPIVGLEIFPERFPDLRTATARALLKLDSLQAVSRDFAFILSREVSADRVIKAAKAANKNLIRNVVVFDVYEGDKVDKDKKSMAISVTLQPADKSLTDEEIEKVSAEIKASIGKATGAVLRTN